MDFPSPSRLSLAAASVLALSLALPTTFADEAAGRTGGEASITERVKTLRSLPAAERRARLREMDREERRGLWFELHRQRAIENGHPPAEQGDGYARFGRPRSQAARAATATQRDALQRAQGTIQYDDGMIDIVFGGGAIIGNRFDTALGDPVTASGTVDTVQAVVVEGPVFAADSAGFVLLGPQTVGGGAFAIASTFTAGITGTTATVTFTGFGGSYTGSSFFVLLGDFASVYVPAYGSGSVNAQGHHGVVGYTGGMGPNITSTFDFGGALNGLVRATGNVLPIELLSFESD